MIEVSDLISCPICKGEMKVINDELRCRCGYSFKKSGGVFFIKSDSIVKSNYFEFYTEDYYMSPQYDNSDYRINGILGLVCPQKYHKILDLGCGSGQIAIKCAKFGASVFGIDVSKDALKLCAERCLEENIKINLFEFDGKNVPFRDSTFDTIVLSDVVEHIDDETLVNLTKECSRLLTPRGRLIIHTQPTKYIIMFSKLLQAASLNRIHLYSDITSPDFEFLHVRYHSFGSLRGILNKTELYPHIWGELNIRNSNILRLLNTRFLKNIFSNQLWCVAFKRDQFSGSVPADNSAFSGKAYLDFLEMPTELDLGPCSRLFINYGFYAEEFNEGGYFRWTEKDASLFMGLPDDCKRAEVELITLNPDVHKKPVEVRFYLNGYLISIYRISDNNLHIWSSDIPKNVKSGVVELKIKLDRTFVPRKYNLNNDLRDLGVAIYNIKFL